jgi:hypothetical protein
VRSTSCRSADEVPPIHYAFEKHGGWTGFHAPDLTAEIVQIFGFCEQRHELVVHPIGGREGPPLEKDNGPRDHGEDKEQQQDYF